jgi:tetraacyldisaccharide 4'-kinase
MRLIEKVWFFQHSAKWLLVPLLFPLTILFSLLSAARRKCFQLKLFKSFSVDATVIVVGNIGIGGNGKTPVVLYLVEQCLVQGIKVGVISRGYGGQAPYYPYLLNESSSAVESGDEPFLIYQRYGIPVVVGSDRVANAKLLVAQGCDILIADDGLQHYRLKRDFELIVIDSKRKFGNGLLLPAGPLREGLWRLKTVDALIFNGELTGGSNNDIFKDVLNKIPSITMKLAATQLVNLKTQQRISIADFQQQYTDKNNKPVNALAGIGDPARFFKTLQDIGFILGKSVAFVDHQHFQENQFNAFSDTMPLLMTEKDAVKCGSFAKENWWYLPVDAQIEQQKMAPLLTRFVNNIKLRK